jgi:hypothetical protein
MKKNEIVSDSQRERFSAGAKAAWQKVGPLDRAMFGMKISIGRRHRVHNKLHPCDCKQERQQLIQVIKQKFPKEWKAKNWP